MTNQPDNPPALLTVRNLSVDYLIPDKPPAHALTNVSFQLRRGETLGIVGESGCGKSTLMLALMRLLPAAGRITSGQINFLGPDLLGPDLFGPDSFGPDSFGPDLLDLSEADMADMRWKHIAMIFQGAMNALNPVRTVGSQIAEAISRHDTTLHNQRKPAHAALDQRVAELLELVGISPDRRHHYPHQYSGGMRQRAMIAMALACSPQIVIADEPTTALDVMVQAQILELLDTLRKQLGLAVLLVTHDLGVVAEICDSVLVMYGGVVAEYADVDTIFNQPRHPYTQALLGAFPDLSRQQGRLASIPGTPPRLDQLPAGCRFVPRCSLALARCRHESPPLYEVSKSQRVGCFLVS